MRRAFSLAIYHAHQRHVFGNPLIQQPLMRHVLSRMALQLKGKRRCCFVLRERGDRRADAKEALGAFIYACGEICDLQTWHSVCGRSDGGAGRHWLLRGERAAAALPGDAGKQYLGRFRQYMCLDVLRVLNKQAGVYDHCRKHLWK